MMFFKKISGILYDPLEFINQIQLKYFLLLAVLFVPGIASAANLFDIPSEDISVKILNALFGGLVEQDIGNKGNPILEPIKALNNGALIVGGILAAYTILAGTIGTAHDGEMLGKKLSSAWVPIRYSIGTALVLPVIGGGYCVIQFLVVWVIIQGIGLAGTVWSAYLGSMQNNVSQIKPSLSDRATMEAVGMGILRSQLCADINNRIIDLKKKVYSNTDVVADTKSKVWDMQKKDNKYFWGDTSAYIFNDSCGEVEFTTPFFKTGVNNQGTHTNNTATSYEGYLGTNISTAFAPINVNSVKERHKAELANLIAKVRPLSHPILLKSDFKQEDADLTLNAVKAYVNSYNDGIQASAMALAETDSWKRMKEASASQGWMLAGSWFTRILIINNSIRAAMSNFPSYEKSWAWTIALGYKGGGDLSSFFRKLTILEKTYTQKNSLAIKTSEHLAEEEYIAKEQKASGNKNSDGFFSGYAFTKFVSWLGGILTGINIKEMNNDERHPILILSDMGSRLSNGLATATASVLVGSFFFGTGGILIVKTFFGLPLQGIIAIALTAEFVIPTLPYMIWIGCVLGWCLLVFEAVIAAPLWAIMHLHPNGDDLTGRGGNGYSLVLSLIFRPTLMIFGVIAAILISSIMGEFINKTFFTVFMNSLEDLSGIGHFLAGLMGLFLYVGLMFTLVKQSFGIIHKLPDQLMRWMGGSASSELGAMASGFQGDAEKTSTGAAVLGGVAIGKGSVAGLTGVKAGAARLATGAKRNGSTAADTAEGNKGKGKDGALSAVQKFGTRVNNALGNKDEALHVAGNQDGSKSVLSGLGRQERKEASSRGGASDFSKHQGADVLASIDKKALSSGVQIDPNQMTAHDMDKGDPNSVYAHQANAYNQFDEMARNSDGVLNESKYNDMVADFNKFYTESSREGHKEGILNSINSAANSVISTRLEAQYGNGKAPSFSQSSIAKGQNGVIDVKNTKKNAGLYY